MAKRNNKFSYRTLKVILVILILAIIGGFEFYRQNLLENRAVLNWSSKQRIKPANRANIQANQLNQLNFEGNVILQVNDGQPTFSSQELSFENGAWAKYGPLDNLNRATVAEAVLDQSLMPTKSRNRLTYKPSGWQNYQVNYKENTGSLYNRSHLIAFQLTGEEDNPQNLITGTWQMNSDAMEFYETEVKYYIKQTNHHVRYQVTPIYRNDELVARGVHMMARSIEDNAISFNIYIFNVQPDINIDYATGLAGGTAMIYRNDND